MPRKYPETREVDQVDDYHGTKVADPYRWLEQPAHTPEVAAWIEGQNGLTRRYFEAAPEHAGIRRRLTELWNFPKAGPPFRRGSRYFQFRNSGLQNQDVLWVMEHPKDVGRVLLDPNELSEDGRVALAMASASPDGEVLAYALSEGGSDWNTWRFLRVGTGEVLPDLLEWSKFSFARWHPDGSGVWYMRFPPTAEGERLTGTNEGPQLCFHRLGGPQSQDEVVYERPDEPQWMFGAQVSDDERYLVLTVSRSTESRNLLLYRPLTGGGEFTPLVGEFEQEALFLGNDGDTFYLQTDRAGGQGKVVAVDLNQPDGWRDVVPESEHLLEVAALRGDEFLLVYAEHASNRIRRRRVGGEWLGEVPLPGIGSVYPGSGQRDDEEVFFLFTSFLEPPAAYRLDLASGGAERLSEPVVDFPADEYEVTQEFATSRDGTRVPYFLVARRDLERNGDNPTLLYGYGGFNISLLPVFSASRLAWLERGGSLVVANLRGGGEYGRDWHEAGILGLKQNVFDDFIAVAEHLIDSRVTRPERLAIQGGSNGGLLVGAAMTQRPELFGAVNAQVGVLDMLRYHLFTIGSRWASDYGRADDPEHFPFLHAYSPLHNLADGVCYPATLITTGDHDDRVVPAHSFKFAARLQKAQSCDAPVLLRVETRAGHGMGKPTDAIIEEHSQIWAFLLRELGVSEETRALGAAP